MSEKTLTNLQKILDAYSESRYDADCLFSIEKDIAREIAPVHSMHLTESGAFKIVLGRQEDNVFSGDLSKRVYREGTGCKGEPR